MSPAEAIAPVPGSLFRSRDLRAARRARAAARRTTTRSRGSPRPRVARSVQLVRMVGHGSSDNAASYGVYAFGLLPRWTAMRDSITLTVHYDTPHRPLGLDGDRPLAVRPDARRRRVPVAGARKAGAFTVAITNDPDSDLAAAAEATIPLGAGPELAVAATKTYVNTLARARPARRPHRRPRRRDRGRDPRRGATCRSRCPAFEAATRALALPFAYTGRMFVIGRGTEFATAREIALKLLETCRVAAEPLTATDLAHGPVAALDPALPRLGDRLARRDAGHRAGGRGPHPRDGRDARRERNGRDGRDGQLVPAAGPPDGAGLALAAALGRPGPALRLALSRARGLDPDAPTGLNKVTLVT